MFYNSQLLPYALGRVRSFSSQIREGTFGYVQRLDIFNRRESQEEDLDSTKALDNYWSYQ